MTDAERLDRLRVLYEGCAETDSNQAVGIGHPVFLLRLLASRDATIADLERRLAEAQAEIVDWKRYWESCEICKGQRVAPPPPVAEASGEPPRYKYPSAEQAAQMAYFYEHQVPQPTADHTERAREMLRGYVPAVDLEAASRAVSAALAAAERAGAEKMRERAAQIAEQCFGRARTREAIVSAIRALAARDAALKP